MTSPLIKPLRSYFDTHGFTEIIAPALNQAIPIEEHLHPFRTVWDTIDGHQDMFLSTSPERSLKLALANGVGNCYSIGHAFRNLESSGPHHSPEFLMLEWYRQDATARDIMHDVEDLVFTLTGKSSVWQTYSFADLIPRHLQVPYTTLLDETDLRSWMHDRGYTINGATYSELFDQLFLNEIEPHLPKTPLFLTDFPSRMSPLCKRQNENPLLAERFEVYIDGIEIANGNSEETNSQRVRNIFEKLHREKQMPIDEAFLRALDAMNGKQYAGIGMGVDRLTSVLRASVR